MISESDKRFLTDIAMPHFGVKRLRIKWSKSKASWPDIWIEMNGIPVITITQEWARQSTRERRKRLVHELIHTTGMGHSEKLGYSTYPSRDTYSKKVYEKIING